VLIKGTSAGQDFNAQMRKQRSALVETNISGVKTVFGCSGTIYETGTGASGYCFAFDVKTNKIKRTAGDDGRGRRGYLDGGQGPAADAQGHLYVITGNGDFDGVSQWANRSQAAIFAA